MLKITSGRYAAVTSTLALVVAAAGTGYAVSSLPRNSVGTAQLQKNAVTSPKIKDGTITGKDLSKKAQLLTPVAVVSLNSNGHLVGEVHRLPVTGRPITKRTFPGQYDVKLPGLPYDSAVDAATCNASNYLNTPTTVDGAGTDFVVHVFDSSGNPANVAVKCAIWLWKKGSQG